MSDAKLIFKKSQDVTDILKQNKREFNDSAHQKSMGFGRKVASVPIDVLDKWIEEGVDYRKIMKDPEMRKKFLAKLNDPEWRAFKTYDGHIG